jgi:dihydrofolate reductase
MEVSLIAALSQDGFISRDQGLPWHLPRDIAHFRSYTAGKSLLIGRRTYEEMQGWFQPRHSVYVLTRQLLPPAPQTDLSITPVYSVETALTLASQQHAEELVVCGGSACYHASMPYATRLLLTYVADLLHSGLPFPPYSAEDWQLMSDTPYPVDSQHAYAQRYAVFTRKKQPSIT